MLQCSYPLHWSVICMEKSLCFCCAKIWACAMRSVLKCWRLGLQQLLATLFIYTRMSQLRSLDSEQVLWFPLNSGVLNLGSQVSITSVSKVFFCRAFNTDNSCPHLEHLKQVSWDWHETWLIAKHNHPKLHAFPALSDIRSYLYLFFILSIIWCFVLHTGNDQVLICHYKFVRSTVKCNIYDAKSSIVTLLAYFS